MATSTPAPTYQWRKNGVAIAGATNASYSIATALFSDEAGFTVVVTNGLVSVTSTTASVQVYSATTPIPAVIFVTQPVEQTVAAGQSVSFAVDVAGSANPSFQWQKNEVDIAGATGASYTISSAVAADAGQYRVVVSGGGETVNSVTVPLTVTGAVVPPPPPPSTGRIINLSILSSVAGAGDSFTMGYVVGGNATTGAKPLVIRAAGPSLGAFGVPGTLADPMFDLFAGSVKNGGNDNWGGSAQLTAALSAVGAFAFTGPNSLDAAATANVISRDNSVVVASANNGSGTVLAEIYDATPSDAFAATTPRLINVSVRKHLGTGLTAGFVLGGSASTKVLIRAVGPTLGVFGVPGVVADPQLTLFNDKSVKIGENDNWGGTAALSAAFTAVGAFALPTDSKDAALLVTLPPGLYSVQATGTGTTTGVALVEVYEVP
ncbi:MAG: immunoglobulin domain-containing protein [Verrucomicrobia bacterium]|nr:immunoglobulin domain-containing protein [Verrucomicrobiota bacterium]